MRASLCVLLVTLLVGILLLEACTTHEPTMADGLTGVRLQVMTSTAPQDFEVRVAHTARGHDSLVVLARQRLSADSTVREVMVPVDITDCLAETGGGGCPLRVDILLLQGARPVDSAGVGPLPVTRGAVVNTPLISFRAAQRLASPDTIIRPRVNDVIAPLVVGLDAHGDTLRGRAYTWSSSDTSIVRVTSPGHLLARRPGTAVVSVTRESLSLRLIVAVTPVRAITVVLPTAPLVETSRDSARATMEIETGFVSTVRWRSGDTAVLRVDDAGRLTAITRGTTTLTAIAVADSFQRATSTVSVSPFQAAVRWESRRLHPFPSFYGVTQDMWGSAISDVWVVASSQLFHWNGTQWTTHSVGPWGVAGVGGTSPSNVWAVGSNIARWDGTEWTTQSFRPAHPLVDVWALGDRAWAVGANGYIAAFDGSTWTVQASGTTQRLNRVWGRSANEIYAAGSGSAVLRFDGTRWTPMNVPPQFNATALYGEGDAAYLAGFTGDTAVTDLPVFELVDGSWQRIGRSTSFVSGLWRTMALGWVASGNSGSIDRIVNGAIVLGSIEADIGDRDGFDQLHGVGFPDGALLAGSDGIILRANNEGRFSLEQLDQRYNAACANENGVVFLGGHLGRIDRFDGSSWTSQQNDPRMIYGLWCSPTGEGSVAVGGGGTMYRYMGGTWVSYPSLVGTLRLYSTWGASADNVFVVGEGGTVLRWNGLTWSGARNIVPGTTLLGVYGLGPNDVFAVGTSGRVARFNGATWQVTQTPTTNTLRAVWGSNPSDVWAVGERNTVLHFDGSTWTRVADFPENRSQFQSVWGSGPNDVYFGSCGGPVTRWNGTVFVTLANTFACSPALAGTRTQGMLWGLSGRSVLRGFAPNGRVPVQPR
ncbi:MAG: hypothetical protein MUF00_17565 [Gemmatimonadaceae bacterium]|nr:hypothetical protein [Gemmatimonadaceae bacterium]